MTTCDTDAHQKHLIPFNSTIKDYYEDPYMIKKDTLSGTAHFKDFLNNQQVVRFTGISKNHHGRNGSSNSKSSKRYEMISHTLTTSEENNTNDMYGGPQVTVH
jgi:hypothetical protein